MQAFASTYFLANPTHILGDVVTHNPNTGRLLTDAFGKPRPEVRGPLESALAKIEAPAAKRYGHTPAANRQRPGESKTNEIIRLTKP